METLTERQESIAAALPYEPAIPKQVKEWANDNGAYITRIRRKEMAELENAGIVELTIATAETHEFGKIKLSRGPRWYEFWQDRGLKITARELDSLKIREDFRKIFGSLAA